MLSVPIRNTRYTLKGIDENKTLSFCIPPIDLVKETDYCGIASGAKVDKVARCGFDVFQSVDFDFADDAIVQLSNRVFDSCTILPW